MALSFQHTAARRRLGFITEKPSSICSVSTHSRPKAAGEQTIDLDFKPLRFNTQPPEGGWARVEFGFRSGRGFNTQPPEGGWEGGSSLIEAWLSFNTQPPEGGWLYKFLQSFHFRRFNTQPPEGGWRI